MIYTSYYGLADQLPKNKLVGISLGMPKELSVPSYKALAPTSAILADWKANHDEAAYTEAYARDVLGTLDVHKVAADLDGKILLCFEKSGFCHRHLVADWFNKKGYECKEIQNIKEVAEEENTMKNVNIAEIEAEINKV